MFINKKVISSYTINRNTPEGLKYINVLFDNFSDALVIVFAGRDDIVIHLDKNDKNLLLSKLSKS